MRKFLRRAGQLSWLVLKTFLFILMIIIPVPIFFKPEITNAYRRNQITQIEKQKPPG